MDIKAGSTSVTAARFAAFTTATGAAVEVTSATAGLSLWYKREGGAKTAIVVSDLATEDAAYSPGGIKQIAGQEHRIDLPDAAVAAGANSVMWGGEATGITIDGGMANLIGQATTGPTTADTSGAGGTYAQTVTVTDGDSEPIQGATVEILSGSTLIDLQTTIASGVAVPTCDAGTYTLRVSYSGLYQSNSTTIVVTAAAPRAVTLTAITTPTAPVTAGTVTAYGYVYSGTVVEAGVPIYLQQLTAGSRQIYDDAVVTLTSDASGYVGAAVWADGSTYWTWRGTNGVRSAAFAPSEDEVGGGTFLLPGLVGHE